MKDAGPVMLEYGGEAGSSRVSRMAICSLVCATASILLDAGFWLGIPLDSTLGTTSLILAVMMPLTGFILGVIGGLRSRVRQPLAILGAGGSVIGGAVFLLQVGYVVGNMPRC